MNCMSPVTIRATLERDAAAVVALQRKADESRTDLPAEVLQLEDPEVEAAALAYRLRNAGKDQFNLLAENESGLLGNVAGGPASNGVENAGEIYRLAVSPVAFGSGLGSHLVQCALEQLRAAGCTQAFLWVQTDNHRARAFYAREGWAPDGATATLFKDGFALPSMRYHRSLEAKSTG